MTAVQRKALGRILHLRAIAASEGDTPQGNTAKSIAAALMERHKLSAAQVAREEAARAEKQRKSIRDAVLVTSAVFWQQCVYQSLAATVYVSAGMPTQDTVQIGPGVGPLGWTPALIVHEARRTIEEIQRVGQSTVDRLLAPPPAPSSRFSSSNTYTFYGPHEFAQHQLRALAPDEREEAAWFAVAQVVLGVALPRLGRLSQAKVEELIRRMQREQPPPPSGAQAGKEQPPPSPPPSGAQAGKEQPPSGGARSAEADADERARAHEAEQMLERAVRIRRAAQYLRARTSALEDAGYTIASEWARLDPTAWSSERTDPVHPEQPLLLTE